MYSNRQESSLGGHHQGSYPAGAGLGWIASHHVDKESLFMIDRLPVLICRHLLVSRSNDDKQGIIDTFCKEEL